MNPFLLVAALGIGAYFVLKGSASSSSSVVSRTYKSYMRYDQFDLLKIGDQVRQKLYVEREDGSLGDMGSAFANIEAVYGDGRVKSGPSAGKPTAYVARITSVIKGDVLVGDPVFLMRVDIVDDEQDPRQNV